MNKLLFDGDKNDKGQNKRNVPLPPGKNQKPNKNLMIIFFFVGMALLLLYLVNNVNKVDSKKLSYMDFLTRVEAGKVDSVVIKNRDISGTLKGKVKFTTYIPYNDPNLINRLKKAKVNFRGEAKSGFSLLGMLISFLPWLILLLILWFVMMRQMQGGGNKALSFGKSKAKEFQSHMKTVTFDDVAGVEEAKQELQEIIEFLTEPEKFKKLGARIPKGVLLVGAPGTGKTLLARAVAGEAGVPFFSISGSDFVEMFVGVGASRVRDLFDQGKKKAPCIIFIDELDAVGRSRGAGYGGGHDEREQTLNQMLVEMDGFEATQSLILMAATNRPDVLDPALLRPGRFDRQVVVNVPDIRGREAILKVHTTDLPLSNEVDLSVIARGTPGFTGADLENMVNEAALLAARHNKKKIGTFEIEEAKDKVLMGPERKSLVISEEEKVNTAYHEAGHALLGYILPHTDPIHKVTIIPRGRALGLTQSLPVDERHTHTKEYLLDQITLLMGGRVAEDFVLSGSITTGASNDIERATLIARAMVCEWGMSEKMGPLSYGQKEQPIFIGKEIARHKDYSEKTAETIDSEIKSIVESGLKRAKVLLKMNVNGLEALGKQLLLDEVVDAEGLTKLFKKHKVFPIKKENPNIKKNALKTSGQKKTTSSKTEKK